MRSSEPFRTFRLRVRLFSEKTNGSTAQKIPERPSDPWACIPLPHSGDTSACNLLKGSSSRTARTILGGGTGVAGGGNIPLLIKALAGPKAAF